MTMFPAQNHPKRHRYGGHGGYWESFGAMSGLEGFECCSSTTAPILIAHPMAEDESRTETSTVNQTGSTSKNNINNIIHDHDVRDEGWLQLGIGGDNNRQHMTSPGDDQADRGSRLMELDLLPAGDGSRQMMRSLDPIFHVPDFRHPLPVTSSTSESFLFQHRGTGSVFHQQEMNNWAFRPIPRHISAAAASSSSSSSRSSFMMPPGAYYTGPFQLQAGVDVARPSLDFRVVDPPRRPHSGLWFMLQASQNQARVPSLPQIPKSYLRIKDGRMTIGLLMKYLVMKLRLSSESEIEITCRGQQLLPFLTLQHVRDNIWSPRNIVTLLPDSSTADHVMVLHYGRSA